jgi:hypothetical protein
LVPNNPTPKIQDACLEIHVVPLHPPELGEARPVAAAKKAYSASNREKPGRIGKKTEKTICKPVEPEENHKEGPRRPWARNQMGNVNER